ncbi:prepilin-type N-terminal cleavage/methylation domain-containing protein [Myxococcota bacterium]|nr:prepilin-type N-terminal cleavage/methylation domain-containing protein [Myxococcota bacterium]
MSGKSTKRSRGFTLIELMIVVAIIGVLASVAIPSFIDYQLKSKRTEAYANLSALAKAQKSYFAEYNAFVGALSEPGFALGRPPTTIPRDMTPLRVAFGQVGWVPEGDVFFDYDTATPDLPGNATCTCIDGCFTATAYGDLDANGRPSAIMFAHPDTTGQFCETSLGGWSPPLNNAGVPMFDEAARVVVADKY